MYIKSNKYGITNINKDTLDGFYDFELYFKAKIIWRVNWWYSPLGLYEGVSFCMKYYWNISLYQSVVYDRIYCNFSTYFQKKEIFNWFIFLFLTALLAVLCVANMTEHGETENWGLDLTLFRFMLITQMRLCEEHGYFYFWV